MNDEQHERQQAALRAAAASAVFGVILILAWLQFRWLGAVVVLALGFAVLQLRSRRRRDGDS
jgi:Flp pilus assembly protein TadB